MRKLPDRVFKPNISFVMTKNLKILRLIVLVILVLIVVFMIAVNFFADSAVKAGIESTATEALKVEVSVSDVDLSIVSGKLVLQNFSIGNPDRKSVV